MKRHVPVVIYSFDILIDGKKVYIKGSTSREAAERSAGKFLLMNNAVLYTDELWEACEQYLENAHAVEAEYDFLFKNRKMYGK